MATKLINMYGKTILCDNVQTLENATPVEHIKTSGVRPIGMATNTRDVQEQERRAEGGVGTLTRQQYEYFVDRYLKQLPSWHVIYRKQVYEYKMNEYKSYIEYLNTYNAVIKMLKTLEVSTPNSSGVYDISTYAWGDTWGAYYNACNVLDKEIYAIRNEQTIVSAVIQYAVNDSETTPPKWQTAEEREGVWSNTKPIKQPRQVLWGSVVYEYAGDVGLSYGTPYVIESATSEPTQVFTVRTSYDKQVYTRRGAKIQKDILITATWDEVIPSGNWTLSTGSGCSLQRTDKVNVYKLITPTAESGMTDKVYITVKVSVEGKGDLTRTVEVSKEVNGEAEITYLGMSSSLPIAYTHDGVSDELIVEDWFLSTELDTSTPQKYGAVYALIDKTNKGKLSGWREVDGTKDGDLEKLATCMADMNKLDASKSEGITLLGNAIVLKSLMAKKLRVEEEAIVDGQLTVNNRIVSNGTFSVEGDLNIKGTSLIDLIYPEGSIYLTMSSANPGETLRSLGLSYWLLVGKNRTLWGAGYEYTKDGATETMGAGQEIEAGLPNINGIVEGGYGLVRGAFKVSGIKGNTRGSGSYRFSVNEFNASDGECGTDTSGSPTYKNNVYGKSETVQPPALTVYMWQRVG